MSDDPRGKVAKDLTEILRMYADLEEQAVHEAGSRLMPGGRAMVELGPVANIERWGYLNDATERLGRAYTSEPDEDPDEAWSAFQLIEFWSEAWRRELGAEYDGVRPTIATEANFVRHALDWAWQHEQAWEDFAKDINRARVRLEEILMDGERAVKGVPCMYDECHGAAIIRKMTPTRDELGMKAWKLSDWHCPRCKRSWSERDYEGLVKAAAHAAKAEYVGGEMWATPDYAAGIVDMPASTVRVWVHRKVLDTMCVLRGRRKGFVRVEQVRELRAKRGKANDAA